MPKTNNPGDYLVVEDREQSSTYHLQVRVNGKPDHKLMGAAWAALHGGYRGNKYEGPNKVEALRKLKRLYKQEQMPMPGDTKSIIDAPNLRGAAAETCGSCQFVKWIEGTGELLCTKHEFETEYDFVCDDYAKMEYQPMQVEVVNLDSMSDEKSIDFAAFGGEVKALGDGKIGGYLVRFGSQSERDLTGDWFAPDTDYGPHKTSLVYYQHGLDSTIKRHIFDDSAPLKSDDVGVWIETQLKMRDAYERAIYGLAQKGKLGWSSGTASHVIERDEQSGKITRWHLGLDASLTPTPAEPRTQAVPIKSLTIQPLDLSDDPKAEQENRSDPSDGQPAAKSEQPIQSGDQNMDNEQIAALETAVKSLTSKVGELETAIKAAPPVSDVKPGRVEVKDGEKPFKNIGEQLLAVKALATGEVTERQFNGLKAITADYMKATGASEASATDGGVMLQPEFSNDLSKRTFAIGALASRLDVRPIGANANSKVVNRVDETSIASTLFGGVVAYWQGEAGTFTASRPKFRPDETKLQKVTGLYYATDELLQDVVALNSEVPTMFSEAIRFKVEDAVWEGNGVGMPLGITASPAVISVAKETGQTADTVVFENIVKMWARVFPTSKTGSSLAWYVNSDVMPQLDTLVLTAGTAGIPPRFVDYDNTGVMRMKGRPVFEIPYASTLGDLYDIMLIDLAWYEAIDKGGEQMASSIHVAFLTGEQVFRWQYRFGGGPKLQSAVTPFKGTNTVSPFVALAARA